MTVAVQPTGMSVETWLALEPVPTGDGDHERIEVVAGELVATRVGGNAHNVMARRLANAFERQWSAQSSAPADWVLRRAPEGTVLLARIPDVLVDGDAILQPQPFEGSPLAVAEVWSPSNTLGEMIDKRRDYLAAGAPVMVELHLTADDDVQVAWAVAEDGRWRTVATALGEDELAVTVPRPFRLVPNDLVRPTR